MSILHADPKKVEEINKVLMAVAPQLKQLVILLHACGLRDFEFMLGEGGDRFAWTTGMPTRHPKQDQLAIELKHIIDEIYPPKGDLSVLGLAFSTNKVLADKIAELVYNHHKINTALMKAALIHEVSHAFEPTAPATKLKP